MPLNEALYTNNILPRYDSLEEGNIRALTWVQRTSLEQVNEQLYEELGLKVTNGKPEELGWVPRVFILGKDTDGHDKIIPFGQTGLEVGSEGFWNQVQMGKVFAYPVGSENPVQLQVKATSTRKARLSYSRPVTPEELPPEKPARPVKWYHRALGFLRIRKYKNMVDQYDRQQADRASTLSKFASMKTGRQGIKNVEKERHEKDYEELVARREAEAREKERIAKQEELERKKKEAEEAQRKKSAAQMKLISDVELSLSSRQRIQEGYQQMTSVFKPVPEFKPSLEKLIEGEKGMNGEVAKKSKSGLYTKDHFNQLAVYDKDQIDLSKITFGESGKTVTDEDFAAVSFFSLWMPKNAMIMYNHENPDIWAVKSLKDFGLKESQAESLLTAQSRNWWTADLFYVPPRDNEGIYFDVVTNHGREDTLKAFQEYGNGNREPLANIIAQGINMAAEDMVLANHVTELSTQHKGIMACTSQLLDMMKKDPALETIARSKGMDPEKLQAAKGMAEYSKILKERSEAEYQMAKAIKENREPSEEEKAAYLKPILKARLMQARLSIDNLNNSKKVNEKTESIFNNVVMADRDTQEKWAADPKSRPDPGKGKIHMDTFLKLDKGLVKSFSPVSESLKKLGEKNGPRNLDVLADEMIRQEDLAKRPVKELFADFNENQKEIKYNVLDKAVWAADTIANRKQPPKAVEQEKNRIIEHQDLNIQGPSC